MKKLDYNIYVFDLNLNADAIKDSALTLYNFVTNYFDQDPETDYNLKSTLSTKLYKNYNVLLYPLPGFHELYWGIQNSFHSAISDLVGVTHRQYYITSWVNVYQKGEYIDWHSHGPPRNSEHQFPQEYHKLFWHGFYCVDTEPSCTMYKHKDSEKEIIVESKTNRLILGPAENNMHRSSEWKDESRPRITIAFDIISSLYLQRSTIYAEYTNIDLIRQKNITKGLVNRWIPI